MTTRLSTEAEILAALAQVRAATLALVLGAGGMGALALHFLATYLVAPGWLTWVGLVVGVGFGFFIAANESLPSRRRLQQLRGK